MCNNKYLDTVPGFQLLKITFAIVRNSLAVQKKIDLRILKVIIKERQIARAALCTDLSPSFIQILNFACMLPSQSLLFLYI